MKIPTKVPSAPITIPKTALPMPCFGLGPSLDFRMSAIATSPQISAGGAKTKVTANRPKYPAAIAQKDRPTGRSSRIPASCPRGLLAGGKGGGAESMDGSKPDRIARVNLRTASPQTICRARLHAQPAAQATLVLKMSASHRTVRKFFPPCLSQAHPRTKTWARPTTRTAIGYGLRNRSRAREPVAKGHPALCQAHPKTPPDLRNQGTLPSSPYHFLRNIGTNRRPTDRSGLSVPRAI